MRRLRYGFRLGFVSLAAVCVFVMLAGVDLAAGQTVLKFCHNQAPTSLRQQAIDIMAKRVAELTTGKVTLQSFPGGSVCGFMQALEWLRTGGNDLAAEDPGMIGQMDPLKRVSILQLPYLADTYERGWDLMDSDVTKEVFAHLPASAGMRLLSVWDNGVRHFLNSKRPIHRPGDLQGLRIRVVPDPVMLAMVKAYGGSGVPMNWSELYTALQHGVIDGMEGSILNIYFGKMYEATKYLSLNGHNFGTIPLTVSENVWKKLPPDQQNALVKAADDAKWFMRREIVKAEEGYLKEMKAKGLVVNEAEKKAFVEASAAVYREFEPQYGKELMKKMLDYAAVVRTKHPSK